jgi:hypothetical protein
MNTNECSRVQQTKKSRNPRELIHKIEFSLRTETERERERETEKTLFMFVCLFVFLCDVL